MVAKLAAALLCLSLGVWPVAVQARSSCPLRFDAYTVGLPETCLFVGRYNPTCGGDLTAVFAGDGEVLFIGMAAMVEAPILYLPVRPLNATQGTMLAWRAAPGSAGGDGLGSVRLENGGRTLRLRLDGPPLAIEDCPFDEYVGRFVDMVEVGPLPAESAAHAAPRAPAARAH